MVYLLKWNKKKCKKIGKIAVTRIIAVSLRVVQLDLSTSEISFAISQAVTCTGLLTPLHCTAESSTPVPVPTVRNR